MPTIVSSTIGTGGTYTTPQAWEDAAPANLVTDDKIWQGKLKNQEFTGAAPLLTISGITVDSTHYVELTTDTGASFADHADKRTNALKYNASVGAAIRSTSGYLLSTIVASIHFVRLNKFQVKRDHGADNSKAPVDGFSAQNLRLEQMIIDAGDGSEAIRADTGLYIDNCLVVCDNANTNPLVRLKGGTAEAYKSDFIRPTNRTAAGAFWQGDYSADLTGVGIAIFGFTTLTSEGSLDCTYSMTDQATFAGTGNLTSRTATTEFEQPNATTGLDMRLKSGATGADAVTGTPGAAIDISGTARSGAYDIGAWELVSGPVNLTVDSVTFALDADSPAVQSIWPLTVAAVTFALDADSPSPDGGGAIPLTVDNVTFALDADAPDLELLPIDLIVDSVTFALDADNPTLSMTGAPTVPHVTFTLSYTSIIITKPGTGFVAFLLALLRRRRNR